jgi:anti-sigma factor RsiW
MSDDVNDTGASFDESQLSAYLDDELDAEERVFVEGQLADSPELCALLDDVSAARDAVRMLPTVDAPAGFWDRVLAGDAGDAGDDTNGDSNVVDLGEARTRRTGHGRRWAALSSAAAAAVFVAVVLVPHPTRVTPHLSDLTESHAERSSVQNDPVSNLAPVSAASAP